MNKKENNATAKSEKSKKLAQAIPTFKNQKEVEIVATNELWNILF